MLLVVGLGNPDREYARNRHNIGFMSVDAIASRHGFSNPRKRFHGELFEGRLGGEKALLLKPMTYMNRSGLSVGEAARFYKLQPEQIFVFHDELDLAAGKVRAKTGGGHAGHNGIRDIAAVIGPNFHRIRLGIGHPGEKGRVTGHVLSDFSKADKDWLGPVIEAVSEAAGWLVAGDLPRFMTEVARRTNESDQSATTGAADNGASKA